MIARMRSLLTERCASWLLVGLACALAGAAAGAESESERWVPALAVFGEMLAQQAEPAEQTRESAADLSASGDDLRVLAMVDATDGSITLLVPEDETGHWVAEIAVPGEAPVQQAGGAEPGASLPVGSGEVLVASPVVVATAEPVTPAATSAPDEVVEPIPPGQPAEEDLPPEAADRERKAKDETQRWVPAFSIYSGVMAQGAKGDIDPGPLLGPCADLPDGELQCEGTLRPAASGDDLLVTPFGAGALELMTPGLTSVPGRPRLFVRGDAAASFAFTRDGAKEGSPGEFEVSPNVVYPTQETIRGQGSATTAEVKPLLISAGAGVAFTVDAWERRLRVKPSVEYMREEIEATGVLHRAARTRVDPPPTVDEFPEGFRLIELSGDKKQVFHGIGPGLEIRFGPAEGFRQASSSDQGLHSRDHAEIGVLLRVFGGPDLAGELANAR